MAGRLNFITSSLMRLWQCDQFIKCLWIVQLIAYISTKWKRNCRDFTFLISYNFSFLSVWVFMGWSNTKKGIECLAQGHNTAPLVRLKPTTPRSWVKHSTTEPLCSLSWFDLILYIPCYNFSVMSGRVFLGWTSTKQRIESLAQGHNTVPLVRLKPTTPRSWVKYSTIELPYSNGRRWHLMRRGIQNLAELAPCTFAVCNHSQLTAAATQLRACHQGNRTTERLQACHSQPTPLSPVIIN